MIYFASDFHLGAPSYEASRIREAKIVQWLDVVSKDATKIYLVGDLFDFWFEYKSVVPKGYLRFFAKLLDLKQKGISIEVFTGNHDMWMFDYFETELEIPVHYKPIQIELFNKKFFIGHGDGLGPKDYKYKFLKKVFQNRLCKWLFGWLHPDIGIKIALLWSNSSRKDTKQEEKSFLGMDKEWLVAYCLRKLESAHYDYFIFGHRHVPIDVEVGKNSRYVNTGDWISNFTYAKFDGEKMTLEQFK